MLLDASDDEEGGTAAAAAERQGLLKRDATRWLKVVVAVASLEEEVVGGIASTPDSVGQLEMDGLEESNER